jgi:methylated-DNA-protein-cysteine methyltransferase related protein
MGWQYEKNCEPPVMNQKSVTTDPEPELVTTNFTQRVYQVIAAIPYGRVATYGTVARLAGSPRAARQVGGILCRLPADTRLPWHRVINRFGTLSLRDDDYQRQQGCLQQEGIPCQPSCPIDLAHYGWQGE